MPRIDRSIVFADGSRIGDKLPGSKYRRSVCALCRQPIRVKRASPYDVCSGCAYIPPDRTRSVHRECDLVCHEPRFRDDA